VTCCKNPIPGALHVSDYCPEEEWVEEDLYINGLCEGCKDTANRPYFSRLDYYDKIGYDGHSNEYSCGHQVVFVLQSSLQSKLTPLQVPQGAMPHNAVVAEFTPDYLTRQGLLVRKSREPCGECKPCGICKLAWAKSDTNWRERQRRALRKIQNVRGCMASDLEQGVGSAVQSVEFEQLGGRWIKREN